MRFRSVLVIACALGLAACGKSPLDKDLEAYVRVNKEIHELAESTKASMSLTTNDAYGAAKKLDRFLGLLENSKSRLDGLKLQDPQMLESVTLLRTGYRDWVKFRRELHTAEGKLERDKQLESEIRADITKAQTQVTNAQNAIIALGKSEGVAITVPFRLCGEDEANCN